jgi:hypothetical protein
MDWRSQVLTAATVFGTLATALIGIFTFTHAWEKEIENRKVELAKLFIELRQARYEEVVSLAAVLSDPRNHSQEKIAAAKKRFRELYIAELSIVEAPDVEQKMVALAGQVDPSLTRFTPTQCAAYELAHALSPRRALPPEEWHQPRCAKFEPQ